MTTTHAPRVDEVETAPHEPPSPRRRVWFAIAGVLALILGGLALVWLVGDDDVDDNGAPSGSTTLPTSPSSTTPSTSSPTTAPVADVTAMWPFPGSSTRYATPEDAARSFASEFLRFEAPVLGAFQQGDSRSGEVPLRPTGNGPVTTILVRQVGPGDSWSVLGSVTDNIEVTSPDALDEISSPVRVTGRALAFEGNVEVEVRADGSLGALGRGFVTGGGDEMRPFEGTIPFETAGAPYGALVFFTSSAENGQVWQAAVMRVRLRSTDIDAAACGSYHSPRLMAAPGQMEVKAYFNCDGGDVSLHPVYRLVPSSPAVLKASLEALLAGPNDTERKATLSSWFSSTTAGMLRSVTITDGHAVVDFEDLRPVIPNASSSAGSALLLSQLDATVFQFRSVESVEYRINGDCGAFNEWVQYGGCEKRTRSASQD